MFEGVRVSGSFYVRARFKVFVVGDVALLWATLVVLSFPVWAAQGCNGKYPAGTHHVG